MTADQFSLVFFAVAAVLSFCFGVLAITKGRAFESWAFGWMMGATFPFIAALIYGIATGQGPAC